VGFLTDYKFLCGRTELRAVSYTVVFSGNGQDVGNPPITNPATPVADRPGWATGDPYVPTPTWYFSVDDKLTVYQQTSFASATALVVGNPYTLPGGVHGVAIHGSYLYAGTGFPTASITLCTIDALGGLTVGSAVATGLDSIVDMVVAGAFLYVATDGDSMIRSYAIQTDGTLALVGAYSSGSTQRGIDILNGVLYAAINHSTILSYTVNSDGSLTPLGTTATSTITAISLRAYNGCIYLADVNQGHLLRYTTAAGGTLVYADTAVTGGPVYSLTAFALSPTGQAYLVALGYVYVYTPASSGAWTADFSQFVSYVAGSAVVGPNYVYVGDYNGAIVTPVAPGTQVYTSPTGLEGTFPPISLSCSPGDIFMLQAINVAPPNYGLGPLFAWVYDSYGSLFYSSTIFPNGTGILGSDELIVFETIPFVVPGQVGGYPGSIGFLRMYSQVVTAPSNLPLQTQVVTTSGRELVKALIVAPEQIVQPTR
jgi:hypothetical protein